MSRTLSYSGDSFYIFPKYKAGLFIVIRNQNMTLWGFYPEHNKK